MGDGLELVVDEQLRQHEQEPERVHPVRHALDEPTVPRLRDDEGEHVVYEVGWWEHDKTNTGRSTKSAHFLFESLNFYYSWNCAHIRSRH